MTIAVGGWSRLWSPLAYQADRGLQIESVSATPVMVRFAADPDGYRVCFYSPFKAYEITGPRVSTHARAVDRSRPLLRRHCAHGLGALPPLA